MLRSLEQDLNPQEQRAFEAWLNASPTHQQQFEQLKNVWTVTTPATHLDEPDYEQAWQSISHRLRLSQPADRPPVRREARRSTFRHARFLIPVGIMLIATALFFIPRAEPTVEVAVANAETRSIVLPDSSIIQLNSGSLLRYPEQFDESIRQVVLEGEAVFTIRPGSAPFVVTSGTSQITVLGTRFNVRNRNNQTQVAVQEGRVRFESLIDASATIELGPEEGATLDNTLQITVLDSAAVENAFGWLNGRVTFVRTPFAEAIEEIVRIYGSDVRVLSPSLNQQSVTGTVEGDSAAIAVELLCLTVGCEVREVEQVLEVEAVN